MNQHANESGASDTNVGVGGGGPQPSGPRAAATFVADDDDVASSQGAPKPVGSGDPNTGAPRADAAPNGFAGLIAELKAYALYYFAAQSDRVKLSIRNAVLYAVLSLVGLIVLLAFAMSAAALLLIGAAHGVGAAFGPGREWLGDLIVGVVMLGGLAFTVFVGFGRFSRALRMRLEQKYEGFRVQQRVEHGRDVAERAAGAGRPRSGR